MSTKLFRGDAPILRQVTTLTPGGTIEVGDRFLVTINGKTVVYAATGTTVASACTGLAAALEASTIPEFEEIEWTDSVTAVTATGPIDGTPFEVSVSTTESNGSAADAQTFIAATTVAAQSGRHWDCAANWSPSGVPAGGDDVYLDQFAGDILFGLDQAAVTLASLQITASFIGKLGLPKVNSTAGTGADAYFEYRDDYLQIGATAVSVGLGSGGGSGRIKLDLGSVQSTVHVFHTAAPAESGLKAFIVKGTHAANILRVSSGSVDVAPFPGEAATLATLAVGYQANQSSDADVRTSAGVTLTTVAKTGGALETNSAITTLALGPESGVHDHVAGAVTTLHGHGGVLLYRATETLSTAHCGRGFTLDFRRDVRSRTLTTLNLQAGAILRDPGKCVTFTNAITLPTGVALADVTLDVGDGRTVEIS